MNDLTASSEPVPAMLSEAELKYFVDANCRFFEKVAPDQLVLKDPFIEFSEPVFLDFTGLIEITGGHSGSVYLTMPRAMVLSLTRVMGEQETSEETLRDAVGEIASMISSNAREQFGPRLGISVPRSLVGSEPAGLPLAPTRFVLPIGWQDEEAFLVIALEGENAGAAPAQSHPPITP